MSISSAFSIPRSNEDEPNGLVVKQEGSSQARYFVSRLIPAHKDPPYEQVRVETINRGECG